MTWGDYAAAAVLAAFLFLIAALSFIAGRLSQ